MAVHIVSDSTSCLPGGYAEQHSLPVIPLKVSLDGVFHREYVEISPDAFYAKQKAGAKSGTTQPGPEDFVGIYRTLLEKPEDQVLSVHVSARMSGTLNSAYAAAELTDPVRVHLYDAQTAGLGLGFMVMEAVRLAGEGASVKDIEAMLDAMQPRTHVYFLVGTMRYLIEGGRIGKAAGVAASILQIKPILTVKEGIVDVFDRPRTMRTAWGRMWSIIDQASAKGIERIGFHYTGNRSEVETMQLEFTKKTGIPAALTQLGPVVGCHTGPETLGVVIVDKA